MIAELEQKVRTGQEELETLKTEVDSKISEYVVLIVCVCLSVCLSVCVSVYVYICLHLCLYLHAHLILIFL